MRKMQKIEFPYHFDFDINASGYDVGDELDALS